MDGKTFWKVRGELYQRPTADPTYYCRGCDHELDCGHHLGCPVEWFEYRFFRPSFHPKPKES